MKEEGFTLIETLVALTIAAIVVTLAAGIFGSTADSLTALRAHAHAWEASQNVRSWLRHAFANAVATPDEGGSFSGRSDRIDFHTKLWVPLGWLESTELSLIIDEAQGLIAVVDADTVRLLPTARSGAFEYLPGRDAVRGWRSSITSDTEPPVAVRARWRLDGQPPDTAVFWIGPRG